VVRSEKAKADPPFGFAQGRLFGDDKQEKQGQLLQQKQRQRQRQKQNAGILRSAQDDDELVAMNEV
jgi:hypothetical protein